MIQYRQNRHCFSNFADFANLWGSKSRNFGDWRYIASSNFPSPKRSPKSRIWRYIARPANTDTDGEIKICCSHSQLVLSQPGYEFLLVKNKNQIPMRLSIGWNIGSSEASYGSEHSSVLELRKNQFLKKNKYLENFFRNWNYALSWRFRSKTE